MVSYIQQNLNSLILTPCKLVINVKFLFEHAFCVKHSLVCKWKLFVCSFSCPNEHARSESPGFWGSWGEGSFIFRELGITGYYSRGAGELAHTFGDLGSTNKKARKKFQKFGELRALC